MKANRVSLWALVSLVSLASAVAQARENQNQNDGARQTDGGQQAGVSAPAGTGVPAGSSLPAVAGVPRLIRFTGTLKDHLGQPLSETVGVTFALYKDPEGGSPLWLETQNLTPDEQGHYSVLLGATREEGLPLELFTAAAPEAGRWLGVQVERPGEVEQARVLLVSVPYALKAADAETLGGKPASAFLTTEQAGTNLRAGETPALHTSTTTSTTPLVGGTGSTNLLAKWLDNLGTLGNSSVSDNGTTVTTTAPLGALSFGFTGNAALPTDATATILNAAFVGPVFSGLSFKVRTGAPTPADALTVDSSQNVSMTGNASALAFKFSGNATPPTDSTATILNQAFVGPVFSGLSFKVRTGAPTPADALSVDSSHNVSILSGNLNLSAPGGAIVFSDGSVLSKAATGVGGGTITGVTAGAGLTGGGTAGSVTLSIPNAGVTNAMLANSSVTVNPGTGLTGGGLVSLGGAITLANAGVLSFNGRAGAVLPASADYSFAQLSGTAGKAQLPGTTAYTDQANTFTGNQAITGNLTTSGTGSFSGSLTAAGGAQLPATGTATATQGFSSSFFDMFASVFNSGTATAQNQQFRWQADPVGQNTASPSGKLSLLFASAGATPAPTGLSIAGTGIVAFAPGQTFPAAGYATIQSSGTGLTPRSILNFPGGALSAVDNAASSRTDVLLSTSPVGAATLVGTGRAITASPPLVGGGTLGADLTLGCQTASGTQAGCLSATDWNTFNSKGTVSSVGTGAGLTGGPITSIGTISIAPGGVTNAMLVNSSVTVNPGAGLTGGGLVSLGGAITLANAGVLSFNGRAGAVTATAGDYSFAQLSGTAGKAQLPGTTAYTDQANSFTGNQAITGNLTTSGTGSFSGSLTAAGGAQFPATGTASAGGGFNSNAAVWTASAFFNGGTAAAAVPQKFLWQAEPVNNNMANASGSLNLLFGAATNTPTETGLSIAGTGIITFAPGQTFPGAGYATIQNSGTGLTPRSILNFPGGALSAADNAASSRTDVLLSTSPAGAATLVGTGRAITASPPLVGGGTLGADLTLGCQTASGTQAGCLSATDWNTFNSKGTVSSVGTGAGLTGGPITSIGTISIAPGGVTNAMLANSAVTVNPGAGLTGGGLVSLGGAITLANAGVLSFNGRAGAVLPASADYSFAQLSGTAGKAQLPGTTAYTDQANTFAGNQAITGNLTTSGTGGFSGSLTAAGGAQLPATGTATATQGFSSSFFDVFASVFNSGTLTAQSQQFRWQADPVGQNTASPSGKLSLLFGSAGATPAPTGLSIAGTGIVAFAPGQTFPAAGYATIQSSGAALTPRSILNFPGGALSAVDNAASSRTDVLLSTSPVGYRLQLRPGDRYATDERDRDRRQCPGELQQLHGARR